MSKQKDPAVLFYISNWINSTIAMDADCRGWYLTLLLHNYDKGGLPNDIEALAQYAGVKFSEFKRFEQVFEQVLKHKFVLCENGLLNNPKISETLQSRELFKDKRKNAGKISYFARFMRKICDDENVIQYVLKNTDFEKLDTKNEQMLEQVFKQTSELYINRNRNINIDNNITNNIDNNIVNRLDENQNLLLENVCSFFGYADIKFRSQRYLVECFIFSLKHKGKEEFFMREFESYKKLKTLDNYKHSLNNFLGNQPNQFLDGKWDDNWTQKLKDYQIKNGIVATTNENKETALQKARRKLKERGQNEQL